MDVNFRSYVYLASHALPLLTNSRGHISVVSSTAGVTATPYTAVYTATKYALQGFFGVLRQELALYNSGVSVTLCMVGATRTERAVKSFVGMFGSDWHNTIQPVQPELVALEITKATVTRQYEVYTSTDIPSKIFISLRLLFPNFADKMMLKSFLVL
ncbi:corticosteroid 11-beta-dehydrogenase isozyme 1-like [Lingula anatina]|uniref:Corticosteroid 11-beta-dehydrogenase isozyme 1-like n=1 Tax=Lingula anatina TaxID=7574 RepID=A0A1S3HHQ8_LINAN|nr:corticosteroid 11-beta-dehydrogenase isozyme 1-like [Lingula anatina]|eukprot:XP_013385557.1 corticosteroid 11-beta-dehydrogenase isozyme 1-like [Lingula anatina]